MRPWIGLRWVSALLLLLLLISCGRQTESPSSRHSHETDSHFEQTVRHIFLELNDAGDVAQQAQTVDRLESLGPLAIPAIERYLNAPNPHVQTLALLALNRLNVQRTESDFSEELIRRYLQLLSDQNILTRTYAMESLIHSGRRFLPLLARDRVTADPAVQQRLDIVMQELRRTHQETSESTN